MKTTLIPHRALKIAYDEVGTGVTLVLLHAFPLDREMWEPQFEGLGKDYRVIAPDLPGFGDSGDPMGSFTVETAADMIADFLDAIGITGPVVLGGCSMGGYIALAFARHPQRLRALVLIDTKADPDTETAKVGREVMAQLAREKGSAAVVESMLRKLLSPGAAADVSAIVRRIGGRQKVVALVSGLELLAERPDANLGLPRIAVPTLVMVGEQDVVTPPDVAAAMRDRIPGSELAIVPGAGHLSNLEAPGPFDGEFRVFLEANRLSE